ncbi:hypothetical protein [Thermoplasma acidophilum]|uniref:Uncharacterized protein n=1 Tax=Thermoplasma acidophilum (strain ATCC 25905 / DSM 1728 / JCM 9062 / NBRC 15155 / AMRC-C165) TaxID=273075 RepID=Q9HKU0_THEAC|nr:hypothetical protein [Thermoplasma acidophilum]MCY0852397.1 hypothetical protein [Thermoplasma acidophilum]CAC11645.1 hypothetical protein [Thermoplasma acidophilum]
MAITAESISNLIDALVYMENYRKGKGDYENFSILVESRKKIADNFVLEIKNTVQNFDFSQTGIDASDVKNKIIEFASLAVSQIKEKIEARARDDQNAIKQKMDGDLNRSIGSLSLFMIQDPFHIIDYTVYLNHVSGSYQARAVYRCDDNISYEFSLNCSLVPELKDTVYMSSISKGIRIPVRKGRSLMSSEVSVDYEKLDKYILSYVEYSPKYINVMIENEDTLSQISFFYPVDNPDMIRIDYKDDSGKVNVDGDPILSKYIDYKTIRSISGYIAGVMQNLMARKKTVTSVIIGDTNLLEKSDLLPLVKYVFQKYSYLVKGLISDGHISIDDLRTRLANINPNIVQDLMASAGVTQ